MSELGDTEMSPSVNLVSDILTSPDNYQDGLHKLLLPTRITNDPGLTINDRKKIFAQIQSGNNFRSTLQAQYEGFSEPDQRMLYESVFDKICDMDLTQKNQKILFALLKTLRVPGGSTEILRMLTNRVNILTEVISTEMHQDPDKATDYLMGPISSLLQAGSIVASVESKDIHAEPIPQQNWQLFSANINKLKAVYSEPDDKQVLDDAIHELRLSFGMTEHGPDSIVSFDEEIRPLYEAFVEGTQRAVTIKPALWQSTPEFRKKTQEVGLDLANFWNICDVQVVQEAVQTIETQFDEKNRLLYEKYVHALTGMHLDEIDPELQSVLADELTTAADLAVTELDRSMVDFDSKIASMKAMLTSPAIGKKQLNQVEGFLREYGYDVYITTATQALEALENGAIKEAFYSRQEEKLATRKQLYDLFHLDSYDPRFSVAGRVRDDLYLGDQTNDCTAFHPRPGVNAWSVPVWLSNPGFNFFTIQNDQGQLAAKLGIVLSAVDNKPAITVDSFEVGFNLKDEPEAPALIREGLQRLYQWSKTIGVQSVLLNTTSNSSGAIELLREYIDTSVPDVEQTLLGGLSGVSEYRLSVTGETVDHEKIHLQSDQDEIFNEHFQYNARQLEQFLDTHLLKRLPNKLREQFMKELQSGNWDDVFATIVSQRAPRIVELFGDQWKDYEFLSYGEYYPRDLENNKKFQESTIYKRYQPVFEKEKKINLELVLDVIDEDEFEAIRNSSYLNTDEDAYSKGRNHEIEAEKRKEELTLLYTVFEIVSELEDAGSSPAAALQFLYGATEASSGTNDINLVPLPSMKDPATVTLAGNT